MLTTTDIVIFFAALAGAMIVGLIAGRGEGKTTEDYFLAGRTTRWWGVAASIFGSNVSANHLIGMLGIGFSAGFAQAHFELGAIAGLMVLCYGFLPVYRRLRVYTLSEYLGQRYDERSRLLYSVIVIVTMAVFQIAPALYIGARSVCVLLGGDAVEGVAADGGAKTALTVNDTYYASFVLFFAVIAASYTVFGGLRAVIWTDVIQSVLLLVGGIVLAVLTFSKLGGWGHMTALDRAAEVGSQKMHLYLPPDHAELPWPGVLTGLMFMHFYYWGTNQFIVQRALSARSDSEARLGIISAGFLKLLIPFFAIGAGVAAAYLFQRDLPDRSIAPDTAFTELVKHVVPVGYGIVGVIFAGVLGAILSSIDSMMNSAATMVSVDIYKRHVNRDASDRDMIRVGRLSMVAFVALAACLAIFVLDPNSEKNFFLQICDWQGYLTPGLLVAFLLGMFWRRATATGAFVAILSGVVFSYALQAGYDSYHQSHTGLREYLGPQLHFFYRAFAVIVLSAIVHVVTSFATSRDATKERLTWTDLGGHDPNDLFRIVKMIVVSLALFAALAVAMIYGHLSPGIAGLFAGLWTIALFLRGLIQSRASREEPPPTSWFVEDRLWAGLLCSLAVFLLYYYY